MTDKLYKVKVETELMVMAKDEKTATDIAKKNAPNEISIYGKGSAQIVKSISDIPEDWKSVIPYTEEGMQETRKCYQIIPSSLPRDKKELENEEIDTIIRIKESVQGSKAVKVEKSEINPETRPDPKPKELDWHDTKSGRPLPKMRFVK